jgi:hypothetical protein
LTASIKSHKSRDSSKSGGKKSEFNGSSSLPPLNLSAEFTKSLQQRSPQKKEKLKTEFPKAAENLNLTTDKFVTKEMLSSSN